MKKQGFSVIEMLVYVSVLALVFVIVINTLLTISRSFNSFRAANDINESASIFMERVLREVKRAESVNSAESILGSSPGKLVLNSLDGSGLTEKISFYPGEEGIVLERGGSVVGLVSKNATTTNLVFRKYQTASSSALIRIEATFESTRGNTTKTETFYGSAVLRGSY